MANEQNDRTNPSERTARNDDISDSPSDKVKLKPDEGFIDLPDVRDIPGQEHVHVLPLGELADTTISSDDEEGEGIFEDEEDETVIAMQNTNEISKDERAALENVDNLDPSDADDSSVIEASLDDEDFEGDELNENVDVSGSDLDVPGREQDDSNEEIGEEDEENNHYSLGSN